MAATKEEQFPVINSSLKKVKKPDNMFQRLKSQFGDTCIARRTFYSWVGRFLEDRTRVQNVPPPGGTPDAITPNNDKSCFVFVFI